MENFNVIRVKDLADMLNCNPVTIWRMQKRGELPPRKKFTNRMVGWSEETIREWFESRPYADPQVQEQEEVAK